MLAKSNNTTCETYKSTQKKINLLLSCNLLHDNNILFIIYVYFKKRYFNII